MSRRLIAGTGVLLVVLGLCGGGYLFLHRFDPPPNWRNPPLYPNAQQVTVQDFGEWGRLLPDSDGMHLMKMITFTTFDKAEQVKAFYRGQYAGGNWQPST